MTKTKTRIGAIFAAMILVSLAFVPAVSAQAETKWYKQLLESNQITVNDFDTELTEYEKVGDQIHFSGTFEFDVEKDINKQTKKLKSSGTISGIIYPDSSIHTECTGDNFKLVTDTSKIGEDEENFLYQSKQILTVNGKTTSQTETFNVSKEQVYAYEEQSVNFIESNDSVMSTESTKVKVDLPRIAPVGYIRVFNDVQYADLLVTGAVLASILAYFGITQAALLTAVLVAIGTAIPEYWDIEPEDIYLDIYAFPPLQIFVEVDYYYYYT
ncbi:hypothetical protein FTO70_16210 [Methanosarcina sp. KYL-1]|uniref:hypothetical protein n=1 Tax=Methanosarcina sp. KYL-1 TaxID=2602068 RepID=UPI0021014BB1|nr:hypothetical protein [Methanosarcina sp. KYL-1]MCQ1537190.1 hypothetical protein [Methanosarcina sp. KYL-1]